MDDEFISLSREVYKRTGWGDDQIPKPIKLYASSDYLLEKLIDEGIEPTLQYVAHDTELALLRHRIDLLGKFTAYTPYMKQGEFEGSDSPAKALLKLILFLNIRIEDE